ncbi:hypothetical protein O181_086518 [Austropuccinia psidii MF-1]|uniref:Reverse transcriptase domain-containing protein n=1 Tax=Austropuccinia psidii MF-1 TaxID=1389203 RepID=A0A9Q3IMA0_9BASI|nr:hypothetical protein [Austropuccinia psidii MF-1]
MNKWANNPWRFKVEKIFQQKDRLTALYPDISEFMIQRKILRQCGGDLEHAGKSRTTEQSSAEDLINILEVTTRNKIGSKTYPPLLRRPAYPASLKSREALEIHITELLNLGVIRKAGHNEEVKITTPVMVACHDGKYRMVGDLRALNNYTFPDRYPITKIQIALTQISQAVYISTMDAFKGFHQNLVTPRARKYLRILFHCGVYEYLRMLFGIKNAPSHFQQMMNTIFPEELSEGYLIIYIDDIIVCSKTWEEHICRLSRN